MAKRVFRAVVFACILTLAAAAQGAALKDLVEADWLDADARYVPAPITTHAAPANENGVTTAQDASGGNDGVKNGKWGFHTASNETDPWWQVDLGKPHALDRVVVYNRLDNGDIARTARLQVLLSLDGETFEQAYAHNGEPFHGFKGGPPLTVKLDGAQARVVRVQVPGQCSFALDEIEVYAADAPETNVALNRPADQKSVSPYSCLGTKGIAPAVAPPSAEVAKREGGLAPRFSLDHTRDVLKNARALYARVAAMPGADSQLPELAVRLGALAARLEALTEDVPEDARRALYLDARRVKRDIAFSNPLLSIDSLLFITRHDPTGLYHMVHQYYGFNAVPGGQLLVMRDPFGSPQLEDVLASARVENGRLTGQSLAGGSFLSPDVSYDGKTILFAYSEAKGEYLEWSPRSSFHIFRVNADGTGLTQLTDGPFNDFDPCLLPDGRIAFISDRRGGYLRCGGSAPPVNSPTYTLHSMASDGSDITCLSFHETQEWQPSVNHAGMIVYTRWDYVDRDTNAAHHIWTCYPDGRDPRSFHGNYPLEREGRPWMESRARVVPGSHKYVATATAHHGIEFGSLVLIDPRLEDDGAMAQVTRLTPEVAFPEAEVEVRKIPGSMVYGAPWPLSEDDYLCVYGADAKNRGVYWIDRFGNRELIYRDPAISCLSPMPLAPRPCPPVIPRQTGGPGPATMAVMNVYDSDFEWPEGTKVAALRIIQVLPKTTPPADIPRIGVARGTNARAVLGTVPVEEDGSAYFEAPAGRLLYFQALDARGMAIQSMRTGTYLHPGEQLTCRGCHERKHEAGPPSGTPLALRRAPSQIRPDVNGSYPFNYVRLVQPVLDRNCVECHKEKNALDLTGEIEEKYGWTRSYTNLAEKYGFYFNSSKGGISDAVHGGSRSTAGAFGAQAAPLLDYLGEKHYGVQLSDEDFHRVTLWLDCNSEFYGAYENVEAQSRGETVWPTLN